MMDVSYQNLLVVRAVSLFDNPIFSDITIITKNSTFNGHKFLLSIRSCDWGTGGGNLVNKNVIDLRHIDESLSQALLSWVYFGAPVIKDTDDNEQFFKILCAASSLGLRDLEKKCHERFVFPSPSHVDSLLTFDLSLVDHDYCSKKDSCFQQVTKLMVGEESQERRNKTMLRVNSESFSLLEDLLSTLSLLQKSKIYLAGQLEELKQSMEVKQRQELVARLDEAEDTILDLNKKLVMLEKQKKKQTKEEEEKHTECSEQNFDGGERNKNSELSHLLNLEVKPSSSQQCVRWDKIKNLFESNHIDIHLGSKVGQKRNIFFLTKFGERPPVATAINLRSFQGSNQLQILCECLENITEQSMIGLIRWTPG